MSDGEFGEFDFQHEGLEPQGYKQSTCKCCGGIKTEIIYGRPYKEPVVQLPKKCDCK